MLELLQQNIVLGFSFGYRHHLHDVGDKVQTYVELAVCSSNLSWKTIVKGFSLLCVLSLGRMAQPLFCIHNLHTQLKVSYLSPTYYDS